MPRHLTLALVLLTTLLATSARADDGLSIDKELDRPGVRLLAVEFYATWCKPCMEAVPKWKALHEKYRDKGLRLIVVAVQDDGRCTNPGWSPNRMVCDEDGRISEAFHVGQNLPAAFLWSWRGKLLVQRGHVEDVAKAVDAELAVVPRVTIGAATSGPDAAQLGKITDLVRSELRKTGKLDVVATVEERELLDKIRRESQKAGYAESSQCKIGEELAANSLLKVSLQHAGKDAKLLLQLFSAESGCLLQSGLAPWRVDHGDLAVAEAVADLIARLRTDTEMPGSAKTASTKKPFGGTTAEKAQDVDTDDLEETVIKFTSTPPASVHLGDKMLCKSTPCQKSVPLGKQNVTMSAEDYITRSESLSVTKATKVVDWPLQADFATLNVTCGGQTVNVKVDGEVAACPVQGQHLRPGKHRVAVDSPCHLGLEEAFEVKRGDTKSVALAVTPRLGVVTLKAQNDAGDDLTGTALLDGKLLGEVPGSFKVPVCGKQLEVRSDGHASWSAPLKVAEGEKVRVVAGLKKGAGKFEGRADAPAGMVLIPAGTFWMGCNEAKGDQCGDDEKPQHKVTLSAYYMDVTETTVGQYKACVTAGRCTPPKAVQPASDATYPGQTDHPVNNVDWTQAQAYCKWRGSDFDLPTEAQWEMAARGGCEKNGSTADDPRCAAATRTYPWGEAEPNASYAVMAGSGGTAPGGSKLTGDSPYGLHDMAGNVWEWTRDWYDNKYFANSSARDPLNSRSASYRVYRGGSFDSGAAYLRAGYRINDAPSYASGLIGLRCMRSSP